MHLPFWNYRNKIITERGSLADKAIGFIYEITFSDGLKYVGKKVFIHKKSLKPLKGKKRRRISYVESDWLTYYGSIKNKEYTDKIKNEEITIVERKILQLCYSKGDLTYYETKWQFKLDVLESSKYLNSNILGKFYKRCK